VKLIRNILGILLVLTGGVWILQGINILPGSFMTGQTQWAVYGVITLILGVGLLLLTNRRRNS
jgi:LPXTG-motif cell wall-anchored protein